MNDTQVGKQLPTRRQVIQILIGTSITAILPGCASLPPVILRVVWLTIDQMLSAVVQDGVNMLITAIVDRVKQTTNVPITPNDLSILQRGGQLIVKAGDEINHTAKYSFESMPPQAHKNASEAETQSKATTQTENVASESSPGSAGTERQVSENIQPHRIYRHPSFIQQPITRRKPLQPQRRLTPMRQQRVIAGHKRVRIYDRRLRVYRYEDHPYYKTIWVQVR